MNGGSTIFNAPNICTTKDESGRSVCLCFDSREGSQGMVMKASVSEERLILDTLILPRMKRLRHNLSSNFGSKRPQSTLLAAIDRSM